jgi:hypothetical protein
VASLISCLRKLEEERAAEAMVLEEWNLSSPERHARRAWAKASEVEEPYRTLLRLTLGAVDKGRPLKGATYKQLAYAGRLHGLDLAERNRWYRIAEEVGLTSEHTSRIIERLKG